MGFLRKEERRAKKKETGGFRGQNGYFAHFLFES